MKFPGNFHRVCVIHIQTLGLFPGQHLPFLGGLMTRSLDPRIQVIDFASGHLGDLGQDTGSS